MEQTDEKETHSTMLQPKSHKIYTILIWKKNTYIVHARVESAPKKETTNTHTFSDTS